MLNIIADTSVGGAEAVLLNVLTRVNRHDFDVRVASVLPMGQVGRRLQEQGIAVTSLDLPARWSSVPRAVSGLTRCIRDFRPDVVQTWMYHADLLGGIATRLRSRAPVVWSVHHASLDRRIDSLNTRLSAAVCSRLSRNLPARIAVVSESARTVHERAGYCAWKLVVIPNGFDVAAFRPDPEARAQIRSALKLDPAAPVIGLIGRFHPHKDHGTFVRAAALVAARHPRAQFVCAGDGVDGSNSQLCRWIDQHGLRTRFHLLGLRSDIPQLTASLDAAVCCSRTEAFPSVVGEAMACAVPCVVTDVGDCRRIVGDTGLTVPAGDAAALSVAISQLLELPREARDNLGRRARQRIVENFTIEQTAARYTELWRDVAHSFTAPRSVPTGAAWNPEPTGASEFRKAA